MTSVFSSYQTKAWPHRFAATLNVFTIAGGTPTDEKVAEGWLKTKLTDNRDDLIREAVAKTMVERGITVDEAAEQVDSLKHLNGFKRDAEHGLYIEGRQAKAMLKEAVSVAVAAGKISLKGWGETRKFITSYFPEHVFVLEDRLYLGVNEPTGIMQRFVHTFRGTGIQYEEYVEDAKVSFTVVSDHDFTDEQWAMIWLTAEQQGIGASRSQGFGRFEVTSWERLSKKGARPGVNISNLALTSAVLKVLQDEIAARQKAAKEELADAFSDTGTSQSIAQLPDGTKVATVSLAGGDSKSAAVVDEAAFLAWAVENYPGEVVMHVREDSKKKWLDGCKAAGKPVDVRTGQLIPGVEVRDSNPYVSVRFRAGGKDAVVTAWQAGELSAIELVAPPAIEAGVT